MSSKWVRVGSIRRFDHVAPDKAQALKVLEEASGVHGAWQNYERALGIDGCIDKLRRGKLLAECADVIQAALNLVAALGVEDFRPWMKECERRSRERGRITDGR